MPLHDWTDTRGWDGVHHVWITELLRWIKPRLPADYRVYIGSTPGTAFGPPRPEEVAASALEPDEEIPVAALELCNAVYLQRQGLLVAAVELAAPWNKDGPITRATYLTRYMGYLLQGVHLLLVDVHPRRPGDSFADQIAKRLAFVQPPLAAPCAVAYRVGGPVAPVGRYLSVWRRPMIVGAPLPLMALPISEEISVPVDLEQTYMRAAADAYLT